MTKLLFAASAAAILTVAGHIPAMAQSSTTGMSTPMITCRDITTMDRDMARSVVFYVSGFQAASGSMQNQAGLGTTGTTGSTTMDTTSSTAADAGSGTTGTTGTTAADADSGTDATGSTSAAAGGAADTSGSASGASGGASSAVMAQLPGFSSIDIDKVMSDCASSPDRQLSEVIGMVGGAGSTAQ